MTEITPELVEKLTKSAGALETFVSEMRQEKANEYKQELPDLEKSLKDFIEEVRVAAIAEAKSYVDEKTAATRPALGDEGGAEFKSIGDWLVKAMRGQVERKDFGEGSGGVGGYMVPDQFIAQIMKIPMEQGIVRSHGGTVIPMGSDTARIPALNATSHATNFYGGMLGYWLTEAQAITPSSWTAKEVALAVNTLAAVGKVSKQLLVDSPLAMSAVIERSFGEIITFMEDQAFFDGNGSGKPQGIIGSACEVAVTRGGATAIDVVDILGMLKVFLGNEDRAVWCANRDCLPQLYTLEDTQGNALFVQNMAAGGPPSLMGIPLIWTEKCSALGTKGDLVLADWSYYVIGDRQQVAVDWADQLYFLTIQDAVRLYERIDGKPWMDATYTPRKGAARSPFVILN